MKKFWNQKLERALAFVLSVLLVVNSIPLAGVSIAATNEDETPAKKPQFTSVIYGGDDWQTLIEEGIHLDPEMFGIDINASSGTESGEPQDGTDGTSATDDQGTNDGTTTTGGQGTTDGTNTTGDQGTTDGTTTTGGQGTNDGTTTTGDQGTTDGTTTTGDQGTTDGTTATGDQGTTDGTTATGDQGTTDGTTTTNDQGTTDGTSTTGGQGTADGTSTTSDQSTTGGLDVTDSQVVVVAQKYADGQATGDVSGSVGNTNTASNSDNEQKSDDDTNESKVDEVQQAPEAEEVKDNYTYSIVSNDAQLIAFSEEDHTFVKVSKSVVGTASIRIFNNGKTVDGAHDYDITVSWAEVPEGIKYVDVNQEEVYLSETGTLQFKKHLDIIPPEGWEISKDNMNHFGENENRAIFRRNSGPYNGDDRVVYLRNEKQEIAEHKVKLYSTFDSSVPSVGLYSIDGQTSATDWKLYCYDDSEEKSVNVVLTIDDGQFALENGNASHVTFYFRNEKDKDNWKDDKTKDKNIPLQSSFKGIVKTHENKDAYSFDVVLPTTDHEKYVLYADVYDDYANVNHLRLDGTFFQFVSITLTYGLEQDEECNRAFLEDGTSIFQAPPKIRCMIEGSAKGFKEASYEYLYIHWRGGNATATGRLDNLHEAGNAFQYYEEVELSRTVSGQDYDNNSFNIICKDDYGHEITKQVSFITDRTKPALDFVIKPISEDDSLEVNGDIQYTNNANAKFIIKDQHIDPNMDMGIMQRDEDMVEAEDICNVKWTYNEQDEQWEYVYDLSKLKEGVYSFSISGNDKAGNKLKAVKKEENEWNYVKEENDDYVAIKDVVIDRSAPEVHYHFEEIEESDEGGDSQDKPWYGGTGDIFKDRVKLVIVAEDKYSPISSVGYVYTPVEGEDIGESTKREETVSGSYKENGVWKYTATFIVPTEELVKAQTSGDFEIFAMDILSKRSEKKDILNVSWDSIQPILKVESENKYNLGTYNDLDSTPTAFCTKETTKDTLTIRITDKDFGVENKGKKNLPVVKIDGNPITIVIGEVPDSETGTVYVATKEDGSEGDENTWVIKGVVVEKAGENGSNDHAIEIQYRDLAGNDLDTTDDFSAVCKGGILSYSPNGPIVSEPSWKAPENVGDEHDGVYWVKENNSEFTINLTNDFSVNRIDVTLKQNGNEIASQKGQIWWQGYTMCQKWENSGSCITNAAVSLQWNEGNSYWLLAVKMACQDGEYEVVVDSYDKHDFKGEGGFKILVDSTYPEAAGPVYDEDNVVRVEKTGKEENDAIRYYGKSTQVTIGAADPTTKIKQLMYEVTDADGNVKGAATPIDAEDTELSDGGKKASLKIDLPKTGDEEFDGRIRYWSTNEFDLGKNQENAITTQRIIVDKTKPKFSYKFDQDITTRDGVLFCKEKVNLVLTVKEKYFHSDEVKVTVNTDDEEYKEKKYTWTETTKGSGVWTCTLPMKKDTDYFVTVSYKDRSGNFMELDGSMESNDYLKSANDEKGEFQFRQISVDTTKPVMYMEVVGERMNKDEEGPAYYKQEEGINVVIHVFEKHFDPKLVIIEATAINVEGTKIDIGSEGVQEYYQNLIVDPEKWENGEKDEEHVITLPIAIDARYHMEVTCTDSAENICKVLENHSRKLDFVLDRTNPDDVNVAYSAQKKGKPGETMYYQDQVEVVLQTKDDVSGIREIQYSFTPFTKEGEKPEGIISGRLANPDFGKIDKGMSTFKATIWLPEGALNENNQLNGYLSVTAVNGSKLTTSHNEGTRIVVDNIAPQMVGEATYQPGYLVRDQKYYFQDSLECFVSILEANFIASDLVVTINGNEEAQTEGGWPEVKKYVHSHKFTQTSEGEYVIKMTYTDQSGNKMKDFVSPTLIVDKTDPVITAEVSAAGAVNEEGGIRYYSSNQSLIVTVRERNFDPDAVKVNVTAFGVDGRTVLTEEHKPTGWSDLGNDIHQTIITLSTDGIYEVSASCTDLSGRPSAVYKMNKIAIDKTAPAGLNITYSAPVREASIGGVAYQYYNGPVNVVVSANDDISGVSAFEYRFVRADGTSGVNVSIDTITIGQGQISYGNGNTAATYSFVLPGATLTANGQLNGTLEVRAINRSSLSSEVKDTKRIVADNLAPTLDVTYNDHVKEDGGIWYFNQAISASFSIGEANFYQEDFGFRVTKDGRDIASEIAWSNRPNDKHFGDFALSADGRYEVSMNYADRSGNAAPNYKSKAMIVDTVAPKVTITGISNQMASRDDTIGFVITIEDENLNLDEVTVLLQGVIVNEKGETSRINLSKEVEAQASQDGKSMTVVVTNLEKDAVYTVSCTALDKANNITDAMLAEDGKSYKKMVFSVNRNGSTYLLSEETEKFIGGFSKEPSDIVVTEINPTELKNIKVTLFKNDQTIELVEGTDYQVKKTGSIDTWYQYVYTVDKDVLRDDGVYRMAFYSEDRAGNVSNNTLDNKNVEISFAVDKTIPNVIITNLEEGVTYPVESLTVNIQASDNLKLVRGVAYLDGKECKTWDEQALSAASTGSSALSLEIKDDSVKARTLRVVVTDAAGNETEKVVSGFFVTTNLWIRYVNNKPLLFTSIGAVGVGSPSVAFLFRRRRRRFR